ncbi:hypothetical protein NESM_000930600 [Novymonas esmeraldas]|uniref:Surface antigen-like protein n=1 Tax=Novymonas esmeraldas TaxID=1808958 RepID=A0AAW0F0Z8_9TRYP
MAQSLRRIVLAAILALAVLLVTHRGAHAAITEAQRATTLSFLQRFPQDIVTLRTAWTGTNYCSWGGVSCDADGIVSINLAGRGLQGHMPDIDDNVNGTQIMVVSIDMSDNRGITGNFGDDWAVLKNLRRLDLSSTGLYGNIPDAWNGMTALEEVKITNTAACRNLPNWNIASLRTINFANNNMGGNLVSSWGSMVNLASVDITGNRFCGCVPNTWTSTVLRNAAGAVGGNLVAANCGTSNRCSQASFSCPADGRNSAIAPASTAAVALLAVLATVAASIAA